jgi:hypothetical protein
LAVVNIHLMRAAAAFRALVLLIVDPARAESPIAFVQHRIPSTMMSRSSATFAMKSSPNFTKLYLRATNQKTPAPNLLLAGNPACDHD